MLQLKRHVPVRVEWDFGIPQNAEASTRSLPELCTRVHLPTQKHCQSRPLPSTRVLSHNLVGLNANIFTLISPSCNAVADCFAGRLKAFRKGPPDFSDDDFDADGTIDDSKPGFRKLMAAK